MAQRHWSNQDNPPGLAVVAGEVGVTTVMDMPQAAHRPYAFVPVVRTPWGSTVSLFQKNRICPAPAGH
jgi:hypothetical protein